VVLLDDLRVEAAQPLAAHGETAVSFSFWNVAFLQQGQGSAARANEDKTSMVFLFFAALEVAYFYAPLAVVHALQIAHIMAQVDVRVR
jgi:hypothetical protein